MYRHWPTPTHIVESILSSSVARDELTELTGDFEHDLALAVRNIVLRLADRPVHLFYDAVRIHGNPSESPTMSERYITGLVAPVRDVIAAAETSGRITAGDVDPLTAAICGPLLFEHLLLGREVPADAAERAVGEFLAWLG